MIYYIGPDSLVESTNYQKSTVEECLEYFKSHTHIAVDTETQGFDPHSKDILCIQIGDKDRQYVIDVRSVNILLFKDLLESKTCILHNAKFDYKFLKHAGIVMEHIYDTMVVESVLYCGFKEWGYSLLKLADRYLGIDLDKTTRGEFFKLTSEPFTDQQIEYAALDVAYLHEMMEIQMVSAKKWDLEYCVNLENNVCKALADIEYNGIYLNTEKWGELTHGYKVQQKDLQEQLDELIKNEPKLEDFVPNFVQGNLFGYEERGLEVNYGSPKQMGEIFKALLGYEVESTGDEVLSKLVDEHEFFDVLKQYREVSKVVSTYGDGFLKYVNKHTGRVETSFWQV